MAGAWLVAVDEHAGRRGVLGVRGIAVGPVRGVVHGVGRVGRAGDAGANVGALAVARGASLGRGLVEGGRRGLVRVAVHAVCVRRLGGVGRDWLCVAGGRCLVGRGLLADV